MHKNVLLCSIKFKIISLKYFFVKKKNKIRSLVEILSFSKNRNHFID